MRSCPPRTTVGEGRLPPATAVVGLDWGTTRLRAYKIAAGGGVLERRDRAAGILKVADGDFAAALDEVAGDWLEALPEVPVVAAGMIGSRQGWREVAYVPCPAGLPELAAGLGTVTARGGRPVRLVPGVSRLERAAGFPDVMRGEETQVLGLLAGAVDAGPRCVVLPGTHSKWAWTDDGRVLSFATYMTGELFELVTRHGILGRLMGSGDIAPDAFARGLARASASAGAGPGRLLHDLFSARTLPLFGALPADGIAGYLSGLLIGAEVVAATAERPVPAVTLLGGDDLAGLYAQALSAAGVAATIGTPDIAARGLLAVARAAGLTGDQDHA